ncbi:hypothetical protein, partial [Staphylococcus epidermidis]|uniref:hypothetical protein n=1 Tax=Staphylococcus epidermidis TaxID=1282 RepID=UPI003398E0CA
MVAIGVRAEQGVPADAASQRHDRDDFDTWFRLDRFPDLALRHGSMLTVRRQYETCPCFNV